jgi:hypothetical protein
MVAVACVPLNGQYTKYGAGRNIADTVGNASAGNPALGILPDLVWPALTNAPDRNTLMPLDAAGATAIGGTIGVYAPLSGFGPGGAGDAASAD